MVSWEPSLWNHDDREFDGYHFDIGLTTLGIVGGERKGKAVKQELFMNS